MSLLYFTGSRFYSRYSEGIVTDESSASPAIVLRHFARRNTDDRARREPQRPVARRKRRHPVGSSGHVDRKLLEAGRDAALRAETNQQRLFKSQTNNEHSVIDI